MLKKRDKKEQLWVKSGFFHISYHKWDLWSIIDSQCIRYRLCKRLLTQINGWNIIFVKMSISKIVVNFVNEQEKTKMMIKLRIKSVNNRDWIIICVHICAVSMVCLYRSFLLEIYHFVKLLFLSFVTQPTLTEIIWAL